MNVRLESEVASNEKGKRSLALCWKAQGSLCGDMCLQLFMIWEFITKVYSTAGDIIMTHLRCSHL
jgi:hypothetical protein